MASAIRKTIAAEALGMVGWGYIYGATGWVCTAARVEQQAAQYPAYREVTICCPICGFAIYELELSFITTNRLINYES
ncbi:MAG TPA: hypothetical protein PLR69_12315 [Candidatus Limiplasma sp.]|nr:hypothetical protein [Candidatus Limiplasma sp.]HPR79373.1 hypothetical protein [Candidatus Limiplasma sp.]